MLTKLITRTVFLFTFAAVFADVILYRAEKADRYSYVGTAPAVILGVIIVAMVCALVAVSVAADRRVKAAAVRRVEIELEPERPVFTEA